MSANHKWDTIKELLNYLWQNKLWWMIPFVLVMVLFGLLIYLAQGSTVAPFVYTLF